MQVHGQQDGAVYNRHFGYRGYHPTIASVAETGDLLAARLREGNVHTADSASCFIHDVIDRVQGSYAERVSRRRLSNEPLLSGLERHDVPYVCRIRRNAVLERRAESLAVRPPGRPPNEPRTWTHELTYKAGSWSRKRRVVLVVQEQPGELFLHTFFLLSSFSAEEMPADELLELYRRRGKAQKHFDELVNVVNPALSCTNRRKSVYKGKQPQHRAEPCDPFAVNEARLLLAGLAYSLLPAGRALLEVITRTGWSLKRFLQEVLKVPACVLLHARQVTIVINDLAARHWHRVLARIQQLRAPPDCLA